MSLVVVPTRRALVLGGGGLAGIAWETGILCGLADESPTTARLLLESDVLVGTSAGSTVAAQIGSGVPLEELYANQLADSSAEIAPRLTRDELTEIFAAAMGEPFDPNMDPTLQQLRRIGEVAAATETVPESVRRDVIAQRLPSHDWPDRVMRLTAIDIDSTELVVFERDSGVDLVDAVMASCAVPGAWPPVTIGGRRHMDGGVGSSVNLAVAEDCAIAVVMAPSGAVEELSSFPGVAFAVVPDDTSLAAFGAHPLDPRCRAPSARAGREQGRREAAALARFLGVG